MSKVWFTSDTHFGSQRTLELSKRPFKTVEEMDSTIISNWNSLVGEDDIVYHLGDFGDLDKVKELKGRIVLITGNYDREFSRDFILSKGIFDVLNCNTVSRWIKNENKDYEYDSYCLHMAHEPSKVNRVFALNSFNLFGHIHKTQMIKKFGLNVGMDCHNFKPIDLDTVLFYKKAIKNFYDDEVFLNKTE